MKPVIEDISEIKRLIRGSFGGFYIFMRPGKSVGSVSIRTIFVVRCITEPSVAVVGCHYQPFSGVILRIRDYTGKLVHPHTGTAEIYKYQKQYKKFSLAHALIITKKKGSRKSPLISRLSDNVC